MALGPSPNGSPVRIPTGSRGGPGVAAIVVLLGMIAAFGLLGRLVPSPRDAAVRQSTPSPVASAMVEPGVVVVRPLRGVVWLRTTEIAVAGMVPPNTGDLEATVRVDGQVLGRATGGVDRQGRFGGVVEIVPPQQRTPATVQVHGPGPGGRLLAEVGISIEAGAELLIKHAT